MTFFFLETACIVGGDNKLSYGRHMHSMALANMSNQCKKMQSIHIHLYLYVNVNNNKSQLKNAGTHR